MQTSFLARYHSQQKDSDKEIPGYIKLQAPFVTQGWYLVMLSQNVKLKIAAPLPGIVAQSTFVHFTLFVVDHVLPLY